MHANDVAVSDTHGGVVNRLCDGTSGGFPNGTSSDPSSEAITAGLNAVLPPQHLTYAVAEEPPVYARTAIASESDTSRSDTSDNDVSDNPASNNTASDGTTSPSATSPSATSPSTSSPSTSSPSTSSPSTSSPSTSSPLATSHITAPVSASLESATPDSTSSECATSEGADTDRRSEGQLLRLAMALIDGTREAAADRQDNVQRLRERMAVSAGQAPAPADAAGVRRRIKALARTADRGLAEQLQLLLRVEDEKLYEQDGCRSMLVWMDVHLRLGRIAASERLRVARKLLDLPVLAALFALGRVSFSQLRIVTRYATAATDSEFAVAALELSVSETIEYCQRFRHLGDVEEDATVAAVEGQEAAEAHAALRAYERRSLTMQPIDDHSTRITLELPNDLAAEFLKSLEQVEDWIREGGEVDEHSGQDEPSEPSEPSESSESSESSEPSEPNEPNEPSEPSEPSEPNEHGEHIEPDAVDSESGNTDDTAGNSSAPTEAKPADTKPTHCQQRADAAVLMSRRSLAHAGEAVAMADRYRVHASVDVRHLADEPIPFDVNEPIERPQLHGSGPISRATAQRIAAAAGFNLLALDSDGQLIGQAKRAAPFSKRELRALRARDRSCRMPGCGATRNLAGHHTEHREHGGRTTMENGATVCASCHRLLHEGGFRLELIEPESVELLPCPSSPFSPSSNSSRSIAAMSDTRVRGRVKTKIARLRRYRLYDANGREYGCVAAAREAAGLFTRINSSADSGDPG